ncbi:MAG: ATP-binding cassette domain-containing protein [Vicinamibacterales bacterium]
MSDLAIDVAIDVEQLVKVYRAGTPREVRAVDGLSFSVRRGEIFGLLGPNGAGKTTTLRVLTTLARPTSGRVLVHGLDVARRPLDVRGVISVVIQEQAAELLLSVRDNLRTFARFHQQRGPSVATRIDGVLERFGLASIADTKVQDLSGGARRRVQVAKMFIVDTPILFLDEFSSGMDPILKRSVIELLREQSGQGRTIVLTTQILTEAEELCDDILIMNRGREIARGDLHHLKTLVDRLYDVTLTFEQIPADVRGMVAALHPIELVTTHNTLQMKLREDEAQVLELVTAIARRARLLRIEINGATLEDVFVELTKRAGGGE